MIREEKLKLIAETYGFNAQSRQLIEEMAECTVAINKLWRKQNYGGTSKEIAEAHMNLLHELADVSVMMQQIIFLLGCEDEIGGVIDRKIDRQLARMEKLK